MVLIQKRRIKMDDLEKEANWCGVEWRTKDLTPTWHCCVLDKGHEGKHECSCGAQDEYILS